MHDYYYKDSITTMLEHCERTQAVKVSQSVHMIFMANCGVRELHCCYTVFNTPKKKKKVFSSFGSIPDVLFGSVIRGLVPSQLILSMSLVQK